MCALATMAVAAPAQAQSLGDIARQEEARRASAARAIKTLSNADLGPSDLSPAAGAPPAESCYMSKSLGRCVSPEHLISISTAGVATKINAPLEPNWRREARSIRLQVENIQNGVPQLAAVVADEARSAGDRRAAERALETARQAIAGFARQWRNLEGAAANQQIPRAWIEPVPVFTIPSPR